jgi:transketolase C-terminal domain/subunit
MAHGLRIVDRLAIIILLCGDAFMYRCVDQINVLAQSNDNIIIYSGSENGVTHQSNGQPGSFITMPRIHVYEPYNKLDWEYCINRSILEQGVKYIRTHKDIPLKEEKQVITMKCH